MTELQSLFKFCIENDGYMSVEPDLETNGCVVYIKCNNVQIKQVLPNLSRVSLKDPGAIKYIENELVNTLTKKIEELLNGAQITFK